MVSYQATIEQDTDNTYLVKVPVIPEVCGVGKTVNSALLDTVSSIAIILSMRMKDRELLPMPSMLEESEHKVFLPLSFSIKIMLWNEMVSRNISKIDLARVMKVNPSQVDRIFNLNHSSRVESLESMATALGKKLSFTLQ